MKLVLFVKDNQLPHRKNYEAIQRMCQVSDINFEQTESIERLQTPDYDILVSCSYFIPPEQVPKHIKILYRPHFFVTPNGSVVGDLRNDLIGRCVYNSLSQWVKELYYEMVPSIIMPVESLPFGVDTNRFRPYDQSYEPIFDCIVYVKLRASDLVRRAIELLTSKNLRYHVFEYGSYKEEDYMYGIRMSKFMLVIDRHESQGFALQEAMSCNTPLLVMDNTSMYDEMNDGKTPIYEYLKPKKLLSTAVPYWSDECGIRIINPANLSDAIDIMMRMYKHFTPRNYVLRTLSDKVCMERMLDYFHLRTNPTVNTLHNEKPDVYVITSVIHVGNIPWSYYPKRSLFTAEQRLHQTLETIESIRKYAPTSKIVLVEASKIDSGTLGLLEERCDYVYYLGEDEETQQNCIRTNNKGLGDAWLMYKGVSYIKSNHIAAKNIFKISGRYRINSNFNREVISNELPTFRQIDSLTENCVTFFFSVPCSMIELYINNLYQTMNVMKNNIHISIESYLPTRFPNRHIVGTIGAEGIIAVDDSNNVYQV